MNSLMTIILKMQVFSMQNKEALGGGTSAPSKGFNTYILSHFLVNVNTFTFAIYENDLGNTGNQGRFC